ncbi:hypothetical protein [Gordonia aichiensis]|uniref:hypothetical protein n=1 Tax=Gordonia aichiensis TaxID=36820 RepID=UPI00326585FC
MTDQPFPPKVPLDTGLRGGAHRPEATPAEAAPAAPAVEAVAAGIDVQYFLDDPSEAFLVVEFADGSAAEVPLSEIKLARLRAQLDAQAEALARARWELGGGEPDDFVPAENVAPMAAMGEAAQSADPAAEVVDDDEGLLAAVDRKTRNWRDPLHAGPVLDDLQKKEYKGRNVGSILLYALIGLMALGLLVNALMFGGVL